MIVLNNENLEYRYFENMQIARLASMVQGGRDFDYHICSGEDTQFMSNNPIIVINRVTDKIEFVTANLDEFIIDKTGIDLQNAEDFEIIKAVKDLSDFQIMIAVTVSYRGGEKEYSHYIEIFDDFHKLCDYTDHPDFCEVSTTAVGTIGQIISNMNI